MNVLNWIRVIIVLSFFDAFLTDIGILSNLVEEGNPIAKYLYDYNVAVFYGWKTLLPLSLLLLYRYIPNKMKHRKLILVTGIVYIMINIYHFTWLMLALI